MARTCVFCGSSLNLTKEHGWPQWIDGFLPPRLINQTRIADDFVPESRGRRKTVSGNTVGLVCDDCNNGWMSRLESAAKPLIGPMMQGCGSVLDEAAQRVIATWVVKTYLVLTASNQKRDLLGLTPIYRYMYEQVSPMPKHHVLIGAFTGQRWSTVSHMQTLTVRADSKSG